MDCALPKCSVQMVLVGLAIIKESEFWGIVFLSVISREKIKILVSSFNKFGPDEKCDFGQVWNKSSISLINNLISQYKYIHIMERSEEWSIKSVIVRRPDMNRQLLLSLDQIYSHITREAAGIVMERILAETKTYPFSFVIKYFDFFSPPHSRIEGLLLLYIGLQQPQMAI